MKVILVPTDFSNNANNALEYAVEIAMATKAALVVLHVHNPVVPRQSAIRSVMAEDIGRATAQASQQMGATITAIKEEYPSLSCTSEIAIGKTVEEIIDMSARKNASLIIMGTQGASRVANVLFGSNTAAIIERAVCPVLCIPQSLPFSPPKKILFATNFSYDDINGAVQLVEMVRPFNATVLLGHVVVGAEETDEEREVISKFSKEIKILTGYDHLTSKVISDSTVNTGLDALIEETEVDMITLSTRKRNLFGKLFNPSLTKKFSYYARIPMLAFHNPADEENTDRDF